MANKYLRVAVTCIIVVLLFTLGFSYNAMYDEESTEPDGEEPEPKGLMEFQSPYHRIYTGNQAMGNLICILS
jgi:hypothetical protein